MKQGAFIVLILLLLLAFALGAVVFSRSPSPQYQMAMEALHLEMSGKMAVLRVVFWYGLGGIVLVSLSASLGVIIWSIWQRSQLVRPNASGLFPVVRGRAGGQIFRPGSGYTFYHDPNRQVAGSVAYRAGDEGVEAQLLLPAGLEAEQLQVTTQAQAAQVVAAVGQGRGMSRTTRRIVERMTTPRSVSRLPAVLVVQGELADPDQRRLATAIRREWEEKGGREAWADELLPIRNDT